MLRSCNTSYMSEIFTNEHHVGVTIVANRFRLVFNENFFGSGFGRRVYNEILFDIADVERLTGFFCYLFGRCHFSLRLLNLSYCLRQFLMCIIQTRFQSHHVFVHEGHTFCNEKAMRGSNGTVGYLNAKLANVSAQTL